jgi:purine-nucleoside phosphorylase
MQGRFHLYEGYTMREATWHVRVFKELGVSNLILTNASGGLERLWNVGELMLILDHINYMFQNPLTGPNLAEYGPRFPDMTRAYDPRLHEVARGAAASLGIRLREGVYVGFCGPSYETPAEIKMFRMLGASAVGMSTVPEAIVASHCGISTCGISCITNFAAGILDQPLTEAEVIETASRTAPVFEMLIKRIVVNIISGA